MPRKPNLWGGRTTAGVATALLALSVGQALSTRAVAQGPAEAARLAQQILDDSRPQAEREAIVRDHPRLSVELIAAMTADLKPGTKEEYRRIPWIWRVAIAAGKRNDEDELRRLIELALPKPNAPLDDWRAVVLGGGIINGITLAGGWPTERLETVFQGHDDLVQRGRRTLLLAEKMADDTKVPTGTRYDALRIVGVEPWDRAAGRLLRYLVKGTDPELQQGAVSALGDIRHPAPAVAQALLSGFGHYTEANRGFALDALLRDEGRALALLDAVAEKRLPRDALGPKRIEALKSHTAEAVRRRAEVVLAE
jgi:hypothetical protein